MRRYIIVIGVPLCCLIVSQLGMADYLTVSRPANIKVAPTRDATVIERVDRGTNLKLIDSVQTNGYYHVETLSPGGPGWVYRTFVRRHTGDIPVAEVDAEEEADVEASDDEEEATEDEQDTLI